MSDIDPSPLGASAGVETPQSMPAPTVPAQSPAVALQSTNAADVKALHKDLGYVEFDPSPRERMLIDILVATKSYRTAVNAVNEKFKRKHKIYTVKAWIRERPQVRFYLAQKLKEAGIAEISKNKWLSDMIEIAVEDRKINATTPTMYKLIGEAKGFFPSKGEQQGVTINGNDLKINILQSDGRA